MKKILVGFTIFFLGLFLVACQTKQEESKEINTYQTVRLSAVKEKIQNEENFVLYIGRPTCPHCRAFAPQLEKAIQATQIQVYYINTDEEEPADIQQFASTSAIKTVPHLAYYKEGEKVNFLEKGSESSLAEIEDFLKNTQ